MTSTFFGLELANRALATSQLALGISGHNISNTNTAGYTRQLADIRAAVPLTIGNNGKQLTLGTGSTMDNIIRARDAYIDRQFRSETSKYEYWAGKQDSLQMIEGLMNEPTDYSLHDDLDQFWNSWSELAKDPQNAGARAVVKERAMTLVDTFHHIDRQITDYGKDLDANVGVVVKQINSYANQIKELNTQIKRAEVNMDNPNDLKDRRDALVDELSKLGAVKVVETQDTTFTDRTVGIYKVIIGDETNLDNVLIDDQLVRQLQDPPPVIDGTNKVMWDSPTAENPVDLGASMGKLMANIEIRDEYLEQFRNDINDLAQGLAAAINVLHRDGQGLKTESTGIDFFVPETGADITAENITLNAEIITDVDRIATGAQSSVLAVGDSSVALAVSSLSQGWDSVSTQMASNFFGPEGTAPVRASSFGGYYNAIISQMGVEVQQSERMAQGQTVLVTHMSNMRESSSGVSLDEEMTNLIKYQKSYSAAARIVTMLDSMFEQIMSMGVTR